MADKPKKKTQKALGEGRGMVKGVYRSGQYKGKTTNLTKKQVAGARRVGKAGKSGVGKKEAARAMKSVSISDTTWRKASERTGPRAKGGLLVGKDGKPVTGTVTLASGKKATYVRGKRVQAAYKPTGGGGGSRGGGAKTNASGMSATNAQRLQQVKNQERAAEGQSRSQTRMTSGQQIAAAARQRRAMRRGPNAMYSAAGTRVSASSRGSGTPTRTSSTTPPKNPKIGDLWTAKYANGRTYTRRYTSDGWRVI